MSKLYSTLSGDGRANSQTRCAHKRVKATAQSWQGSISVELWVTDDGVHHYDVIAGPDSTAHPTGTHLASGTIAGGICTPDA